MRDGEKRRRGEMRGRGDGRRDGMGGDDQDRREKRREKGDREEMR
jgi:hypothetical protein